MKEEFKEIKSKIEEAKKTYEANDSENKGGVVVEKNASQNSKKSVLALILIAIVAVVVVVFIMNGAPDHIEDTNGADNFALQTIADKDIVELKVGARGVTEQTDAVSSTVTYKSKKFTGVYEVFTENIVTNRYEIHVNHASVTEGNFKMVLVVNGEIVHEFKLNELMQTHVIENVSGTVSLVIAGESASFLFDYTVY